MLDIYVRSEFYKKFWEMEKILFENILKILEEFWIHCEVTKKILKVCECNFRETLQKFSERLSLRENFSKKFIEVPRKVLGMNVAKILRKFLENFK